MMGPSGPPGRSGKPVSILIRYLLVLYNIYIRVHLVNVVLMALMVTQE